MKVLFQIAVALVALSIAPSSSFANAKLHDRNSRNLRENRDVVGMMQVLRARAMASLGARRALANALLSSIRDENHELQHQAMKEAERMGLGRENVLTAISVANEKIN